MEEGGVRIRKQDSEFDYQMSSCFYWNSVSFYITQWSQHVVAVHFVRCITNSWYLCTACLLLDKEWRKKNVLLGLVAERLLCFLPLVLSVYQTCSCQLCTDQHAMLDYASVPSQEAAVEKQPPLCCFHCVQCLCCFPCLLFSWQIFRHFSVKQYWRTTVAFLCALLTPKDPQSDAETACCKAVAHTSRLLCTFVMHSIIVQKKKRKR